MIKPIISLITLRQLPCIILAGFLFFLSVSIISSSCSLNKGTESQATADSIPFYKLPAPKPLSGQELLAYRQACEKWYDSTIKPSNFNGGILVAKNGQVIFERYNGTGHIGQSDSINANTPTHIASVTKTFTAMAVLKLVEEDSLKLDDELVTYFPGFNYPGVTVRHLLNHRSGLPNYLYFMDELGWDKKKFMTNRDVFDYMVTHKTALKNISTPGTHFSYCNTNYVLLALLVEKISGLSFPQYLHKLFFAPLQMKNSFVFTAADSNRLNPSYDWRGNVIPLNHLDHVYGDKNIYSTTHDLLIWDRALRSGLVFKTATLNQAYTPYSNEKPGIRNYGLGWRMNIYPDSKKIIYHNGWWHGNNASFIRLLDEDVTIIAIGNRFCRCIYKVKQLAGIFNPSFLQVTEDEADSSAGK